MTDIFTKEKRSWVMSRIRSKNTKVEKTFESFLKKQKIRFKKHYKTVGSPDFALPDKKIAIFIDGDFWHGYDYLERRRKLPEYWKKKIKRNIERDKGTSKELKRLGWKVVRIWEHAVMEKPDMLKKGLKYLLKKTPNS